ncbi:MAG: hypothetical protein RLN60_05225 [Phycisphaerales bacterium]
MTTALLAWTPFIDPIDIQQHWWLTLIPMALGISMAYKAVRLRPLEKYWKHVAVMTVQIVGGMVGLSVAVYLLIEVLVPLYETL